MPARITQRKNPVSIDVPVASSSGVIRAGQSLQQTSQSAFRMAVGIREQADKSYLLKTEISARKRLREIENEFAADPNELQLQIDKYKEDVMETLPRRELGDRLNTNIDILSGPIINRSLENKRKVLDNQTETDARLMINQAQGDLVDIVPNLLSEDPDVAATAARSMQLAVFDVDKTLGMTKSDGTPMFTPETRATKVQAMINSAYEGVAKTYIEASEDKMLAMNNWKNGEVKIPLPDEEGNIQLLNIRDAMPPETRVKVDKAVTQMVKEDISLRNAADAKADRDFNKESTRLRSELQVSKQNNQLTIQQVEALKPRLTPDHYTEMRQIAIQDDPTTDGKTFANLSLQMSQGYDISDQLAQARFVAQDLSNEDYFRLQALNESKASTKKTPIESGREYLSNQFGVLSKEFGLPQSAALSEALFDYESTIEQFIEKNGREPSFTEIRELSSDIIRDYGMLQLKDMASTIPTPKFMEVGEKNKLGLSTPSQERMSEIKAKTVKFYQDKYNGDTEAMMNDPEFREEMKSIKSLSEIYDSQRPILNKSNSTQR